MPKEYQSVSANMPDNQLADEDYMIVYLYPSNKNMETHCAAGSNLVSTIADALEGILSYGACDGWEIYRFETPETGGSGNYFDDVGGDPDGDGYYDEFHPKFVSEPSGDTENYKNGYGDLSGFIGCHHLVHDKTGEACNETQGYAPNYVSALRGSFTSSGASWAPICSDTSLTEAAVVQEIVHSYIDEEGDWESWWGTLNGSEDDHTLGRVVDSQAGRIATPMMAYHWDDNITDRGNCASYSTDPTADTHSYLVTDCTKEAVRMNAPNN